MAAGAVSLPIGESHVQFRVLSFFVVLVLPCWFVFCQEFNKLSKKHGCELGQQSIGYFKAK